MKTSRPSASYVPGKVFPFPKMLGSAVPVPTRIEPGGTATLSLSTPALEAARRTRYRMEYGGDHAARPRPH